MKNRLSFLLTGLLTLSLCACGTSAQPTQNSGANAPDSAPLTAEEQAKVLLDDMTLEQKIYQLFIVTPESLTDFSGTCVAAGDTTKAALQDRPVGGLIYMASNLQTPEQTTDMIATTQSYSDLGLFISVDEEGGTVSRIAKNSAMGTTKFPPMGEIGADGDTDEAYKVGRTIGSEIRTFGFNLDYAPVADVFTNPKNTVIGNRAFSTDAQTAADMVSACIKGFHSSDMLCVVKHFPGHGNTDTDSHYGTATTNKTLDELKQEEFLPFQSGIAAGADMVMVSHITAPNVTDDDLPSTLSNDMVTGILRGELGYHGVVITDAMDMEAITEHFSASEAAVKAIQAGIDIILCPQNLTQAADGIAQAIDAGELSEARIDESVTRILTCKIENGILS